MERFLPPGQGLGKAGEKGLCYYLNFVCFMPLNRLLFLKGLAHINACLIGLIEVRKDLGVPESSESAKSLPRNPI